MSQKPINRFDEKAIADYLEQNPEFFSRHLALLQALEMPNIDGTKAVSLVERQVQSLRKKNSTLETRLANFIEVARDNDSLNAKIHKLACSLIRSRHLPGIISVIESSLKTEFGVDAFSLLIYRDVNEVDINSFARPIARTIERSDIKFTQLFPDLTGKSEPRCGHLNDAQKSFLFVEKLAPKVQSAALVPLGNYGDIGLLTVGSFDMHHFNPSISTDFLKRIGDLVSQVIASKE